jgi:hypothetical protein
MNDTTKLFTEVLKDALAKKHTAEHPDAKKSKTNSRKSSTGNTPKGPPVRRGASRGG